MAKEHFIKIGSARVKPGSWSRGKIRVARYPDGRNAYIPIIIGAGSAVLNKKHVGVGLLAGGAHGNEPNGPELVGRVVDSIDPAQLKGVLVVLPIMNPWGFAKKARMVPIDQRDLNRSYPGHKEGSFSLQVAYTILNKIVAKADFVIDVHDAGDRMILVPHSRAHLKPVDDPTRNIALSFGSDIVFLREAEVGMLAREARDHLHKTVVSLEIGGSMRILENVQERARIGVLNILKAQGLLKGPINLPPHQHLLSDRHSMEAEQSGIQTNWVRLGQVIERGQPLYKIYNPQTGKTLRRKATYCGIVLAKNVSSIIEKGDQSLSLLKYKSCRAESQLDVDTIKNYSDKNNVVLKKTQGWEHRPHTSRR